METELERKMNTLDLYNNKYDLYTLKKYIYAINHLDILKTQKIDEEFAVDYIINKVFQLTKEDEDITIKDIMKYQPHLNIQLLYRLIIIGSSDNLFPNFENF